LKSDDADQQEFRRMTTLAPLLLTSIQTTAKMEFTEFLEKNPRLEREWEASLEHPYLLPPDHSLSERDRRTVLDGTSTDTATKWLAQVANYEPLKRMASVLFRGGQGHCSPIDKGDPVRVIDGQIHFFQNGLAWDRHAKPFVLDFFGHVLFAMLTSRERESYRFDAFPKDPADDFLEVFEAYVTDDLPLFDVYFDMFGPDWLRARTEIIEHVLDESVLRKRARRVKDFRLY
jgi:hypothetical protein